MENEEVILSVNLNTEDAEVELNQILQALKEISNFVAVMEADLVKVFSFVIKSVNNAQMNIRAMAGALTLAVQEMNKLVVLQGQSNSMGWMDWLSVAGDGCTLLQTMIALTDDLVVAKIKNRAEDIAIIALYAADYAVQFGQIIAQLAILLQ